MDWIFNKREMCEAVAEETGMTVSDVKLAANGILRFVANAVIRDDAVMIRGLGTFERRHRKGYTGRNPETGEAVDVPAKDYPHFRPSAKFKERVMKKNLISPSTPL